MREKNLRESARIKRDEDGARYLTIGALVLTPISGGYWHVEKSIGGRRELLAAWTTASDVRELIPFNTRK